ncbi:phenoloxidase-activating factor 3-like [Cherax quadricarinatus]
MLMALRMAVRRSSRMLAAMVIMVATGASQAYYSSASSIKACSAPGEVCVPLTSCPTLLAITKNPHPSWEALRKLRHAVCGKDMKNVKVCCNQLASPPPTSAPTTTWRPLPPVQPPSSHILPSHCGVPSITEGVRVFFGENARLGAYPWIATLGYRTEDNEVDWLCGGALIADRYILTAGHCVSPAFNSNRELVTIRLGEHDLSKEVDCVVEGGEKCAPQPQKFTPSKVTVHPDFNKRGLVSDDIAVIKLDRPVKVSTAVRPICLPAAGQEPPARAVVAGWGVTQNGNSSDVLQRVVLPFANATVCNPHYGNKLVKEQVCYGGASSKDSCYGDSGGPLFSSSGGETTYTLVGIVSFGRPVCGVVGVPAIYTKVSAYTSWILSNLIP